MLKLLFAVAPIGVILLASEYIWRKKLAKGERARKFIHILAGVWMAFWPLYLPFDGIFILACMALALLIYSRVTRLFHAIYAVKRKTYGDIFYAVGLMACAYFAQADWIFTVAILFLAVADGGAAVIGRFWGLKNQYFVFGSKHLRKSVAGTITFIVLSYLCLAIGWVLGGADTLSAGGVTAFVLLPLLACVMENISPFGLDNVGTPIVATLILNSLL